MMNIAEIPEGKINALAWEIFHFDNLVSPPKKGIPYSEQ